MIRSVHIYGFAFLFCLSLPTNGTAQLFTHRTTLDKNIQLLCHKWDMNYKNTAIKMVLFPVDSLATVRFSPDGYVYFNGAKKTEGVWNYDTNRQNLYIIINSDLWKYKILSLSENELVLENSNSKKNISNFLKRDNL